MKTRCGLGDLIAAACEKQWDAVDTGTEEIIPEAVPLIIKAADECRKTKLYKREHEREPAWFKEKSSRELFMHMTVKVIEGPTTAHRQLTPVLMLPAIADALIREGKA